jgi:phospholipid N-methyltransferase
MRQSFYQTLFANDEFAMAIGRLTLSSAKLESSIKAFIDSKGQVEVSEKAPLGGLITSLIKHHKIDRTAGEHLQFVLHQRNYFVHKLHANLSEYPENDLELRRFISRAASLSDEMEFFSGLLNPTPVGA